MSPAGTPGVATGTKSAVRQALPCGCDVSDQAQTLQAAAAAGYLDLDE
jgi:hypothetical protein